MLQGLAGEAQKARELFATDELVLVKFEKVKNPTKPMMDQDWVSS